MSIWTTLANIEQKVVNFIKGVPQEGQVILTASNKFLNTLKVLSTSATAETVIDLAEAFFPAVTGIVNGAEAVLGQLINLTTETPGQLLLQATQKAASLTGTAKVAAYSNIALAISSAANDATKGTLTPQQIISVNQLVHNSNALDAPTPAPITTTNTPSTAAA